MNEKDNRLVGGMGITPQEKGRHNASKTGKIIMNIETKPISLKNDNLNLKSPSEQNNGLLSLTHSRQSIRDKEIR